MSGTGSEPRQSTRESPQSEVGSRVENLRDLGASSDDIVQHADRLDALEFVHTIWPGERRHTMADVARAVGVSTEDIIAFRVATGFPEPEPTAEVATDDDVEMYRTIVAARSLFDDAELLQLLRVMGASLAKLADAVTSAFLVNQRQLTERLGNEHSADEHSADERGQEPDGAAPEPTLEVISELLPRLSLVVDTLLRKHIVAARRSTPTETTGGWEVQQLAIGFADLIGSTRLTEERSLAEVGQILSTFEEASTSVVTRHGGRVVKLIGDEILFSVDDPAKAARIGWAVSQAVGAIDTLPPVRVGLAAGEVLTRDGDVFGPPVNRAARIVSQAPAGSVLVTPVIRAAAMLDFSFAATGAVDLPGFSTPTELWRVDSPRRDVDAEPDTEDLE